MKMTEALQALLEGKRVRMVKWPKDTYIYMPPMNRESITIDSEDEGEWEEFRDLVDITTALKRLKEGKRIRRVHWRTEEYVSMRNSTHFQVRLNDIGKKEWLCYEPG